MCARGQRGRDQRVAEVCRARTIMPTYLEALRHATIEHVLPTGEERVMQADIAEKREALAALCGRYGVARLEVFGSAARGSDFDPKRSDYDFLVEFEQRSDLSPLDQFFRFAEALERLLGRPVDLLERKALEASRNYIRRRAILRDAETIYG